MPWVPYGQSGGGQSTGGWAPYGTKKKLDERKRVVEESAAQADKFQTEAEKYSGRASMIEDIGKTFVRPFVSLAEIPKNVYGTVTGKENTFGDVNVPVLGNVQSYQNEAKGVTSDIIEGKKPLYSILKPMGSAVIDTAGLGLGSSVAKGVTREAFKQTAKRLIPEGAAYGFGQGIVDSIGNGRTYGEKAKDIATSTAFGAVAAPVLGVGFNLIGRAVSALANKISGRATKVVDPTEAKEAVDEIVGILDRDLKPEEETAVLDLFSNGATKEEIVTEVGKAKVASGLEQKPRLSEVVDQLETSGKKLSVEETMTVKKGIESGKSFEEIKSSIESPELPQKSTQEPRKPESGTKAQDNGDEAFLRSVEERFKASKNNKFREATQDEKGRFTGSRSGITGDKERDALAESIQNRIDAIKDDSIPSFSAREDLRVIQEKAARANPKDLPALKVEAERIAQEFIQEKAEKLKPVIEKEKKIAAVRAIASESDNFNEFQLNLKKRGEDITTIFKSKAAAEEFFRKNSGQKFRTAENYTGETELTTKLLEDLKGRSTVSKQYLEDATNRPELKQAERDLFRNLLKQEGDTIDVKDFAAKVKSELLPLKTNSTGVQGTKHPVTGRTLSSGFQPRYENISLPDDVRGKVSNYKENVYESPIKTSAGNVHGFPTENYFAHSRIEDTPDNTRRVIEIQSDLFQKGRLEGEMDLWTEMGPNDSMNSLRLKHGEAKVADMRKVRAAQVSKLEPYRNTWHERVIREELKKAAQDGKTKVQFPTGETAMKIEGLGQNSDNFYSSRGWTSNTPPLKPEELKVGASVVDRAKNDWIITDVLGDGKFKAVPKDVAKNYDESGNLIRNPDKIVDNRPATRATYEETFDISGKVDTNNPIYKFYEKTVSKYLSKFGGKLVTDKQGVSWVEVPIKKEMAGPVQAFRRAPKDESIPKSLADDTEAGYQVRVEMENSTAGKREFIGEAGMDREIIPISSTFPKWVSPEYRSNDLFEKVLKHIDNGTVPTSSRQLGLYNEVRDEMQKRAARFGERFEELTGTKITPEQETQIKALHKKMFGDDGIEITAQILTPEGQKAFGVYKNKVIKILDGQADPTDTLYHESVHKYLDLFTTLEEQKKIYVEARKLWKTDNLDELEEKIAENFIRYAKTNEGVIGTMKVLFDKVIDRIKVALKNESSIEALYRDILEGKAKKTNDSDYLLTAKEVQKREKEVLSDMRKKESELKRMEKLTLDEEKFLSKERASTFISDPEEQHNYQSFKDLLKRFKTGKGREELLNGDTLSIKRVLGDKLESEELDNILYSSEKSEDEMLDFFRGVYEKDKAKVTADEMKKRAEKRLESDPDYAKLKDDLESVKERKLALEKSERATLDEVNRELQSQKEEPAVPKKEVSEQKTGKSILAERLNESLPEDFKIDEDMNVIVIKEELEKAAKAIFRDRGEAVKRAFDSSVNPAERSALLQEMSMIAKRDGDFSTVADLFGRRAEMVRGGAQSLNMEKASIMLNPQEKYMRDLVNARLGSIKIDGKAIDSSSLKTIRTKVMRETRLAVKKSYKIEDAQALFNSLMC